jgi:crotonobetainyl-CoA:carnitine CoA-transferase CaiB-like acyl-CoA transferase
VAVAAPNDRLYRSMCEAIGAPELGTDERFAHNRDRVERREELTAALSARFAERPADDWVQTLQAAGVPAGKIRGVLEALDAAAQAGRSATTTVHHPTIGELPLVASPIRLSRASLRTPAPPPLLGEHDHSVLGDQAGAS